MEKATQKPCRRGKTHTGMHAHMHTQEEIEKILFHPILFSITKQKRRFPSPTWGNICPFFFFSMKFEKLQNQKCPVHQHSFTFNFTTYVKGSNKPVKQHDNVLGLNSSEG